MCKAVELFTAVPKLHNCAQAVAAGAGDEVLCEAVKTCGGGKAPLGRCGALHAALKLTPAECHARVIAEFTAAAGAESCREIKSAPQAFPCVECVRLGAELVDKYR